MLNEIKVGPGQPEYTWDFWKTVTCTVLIKELPGHQGPAKHIQLFFLTTLSCKVEDVPSYLAVTT